ncbi:hypothetical protein LFL96_29785 [Paraburkholderia sp. D15]|uniref:hypothetical protein n=1 Tax=Paraburkholderia sp. D15 TaxID=2880218 RepID=UPI00247B1803|nr:hypothetical protein [Paraburkholderia sp. D15]WGS52389.1 hypothetical protein LFL96_29785 [Paraburkholderia sp. D15]
MNDTLSFTAFFSGLRSITGAAGFLPASLHTKATCARLIVRGKSASARFYSAPAYMKNSDAGCMDVFLPQPLDFMRVFALNGLER